MKGIRITWTMAMLTALVVAIGLWLAPLGGWTWLAAKAGAIALACFAFGILINLASTIFVAKEEDLWDSSYFKYMRVLWGNAWGGSEYVLDEYGRKTKVKRLLQIDTCRATNLSMWAGIAWLSLLSLTGFTLYLNIGVLLGNALLDAQVIILLTSLGFPALSGLLMSILFYRREEFKKSFPVFRNTVLTIWLLILGAVNVVALIIFPATYYGLIPYLKIIGMIAAVLAAFAVAAVVLSIFTWLGTKVSQRLRKETALGRLIAQHQAGIKQKICPIIVQKPKA